MGNMLKIKVPGMIMFMTGCFIMTFLTLADATSSRHCDFGPCYLGQYRNSKTGTCLPCPDNTFMAQNNHSCTDCDHCTAGSPHTVLVKNCSPEEDAVYKCESGYYKSEESFHPGVGLICEKCGPDTVEKCSMDGDLSGDNSSVPATTDVTPSVTDDNGTHKNKSMDDGDGGTGDVSQPGVIALTVIGIIGLGIIVTVLVVKCMRPYNKLIQTFCVKCKQNYAVLNDEMENNNAPIQEQEVKQDSSV